MPSPQPEELHALDQVGTLLKFAAETVKDIPESSVSTIASAWDARDNNQWTPEIASRFWVAYNSLCSLIKPANVDAVISNELIIPRRSWFFWQGNKGMALSKATARLYLNVLVAALLVAIFLQFIVSTAATLSIEVDNILSDNEKFVDRINQDVIAVSDIGDKDFSVATLSPDQKRVVASINNAFKSIWFGEDRIGSKLTIFGYLTIPGLMDKYNPQQYIDLKSTTEVRQRLITYYNDRTYIKSAQEKGNVVIKIMNIVVLPLLFGIIGSCAYVTRFISDQIKDGAFSSTSPIRHRVRVALGALAGVLVGFGWIGSGISASPLALAFVAGYAIEPVFATIDSIADKFRKPA